MVFHRAVCYIKSYYEQINTKRLKLFFMECLFITEVYIVITNLK